jgi:hypothetical protein
MPTRSFTLSFLKHIEKELMFGNMPKTCRERLKCFETF